MNHYALDGLENDVDPITQEPLADFDYPIFILEQEDGKRFGFDPVSLGQYILKEGKAINLFNRQPLTPAQLEQLQQQLNELFRVGVLESPVNLVEFMESHSSALQEANQESGQLEFALENICLSGTRCMVVCSKFYDEDTAFRVLQRYILPEFKSNFRQLAQVSSDSARMMAKRCLSTLIEPFRQERYREPTRSLAAALTQVKKLEEQLRPVAIIQPDTSTTPTTRNRVTVE